MKLATTLVLFALTLAAADAHGYRHHRCPRSLKLTIGTYTYQSWLPTSAGEGVTTLTLGKKGFTGARVTPNITTGENPSYCAKCRYGRTVYCVNENGEGTVTALRGGKGVSALTGAGGSTHLAVLPRASRMYGKRIFVANYGGAVSSLTYKGGAWKMVRVREIPKKFASTTTGQQAEPHPHMILPIDQSHILVPDLGSDRLWVYVIAPNADFWPVASFKMRKFDGPRHAARGRGYNVYVVNEISNTVARVRGCAGKRFRMCQRRKLLPGGKSKDVSKDAAAAIRVSKDGRFLYASVRKDGTEEGKIVVFKLGRRGQILWRVGVYSSGGVHPRDFTIVERAPDCHSYIAVANRDSNNIVLFKRDRTTGKILRRVDSKMVKTPTSVLV